MADLKTTQETTRTPIDGSELIRLATTGANWKATLQETFNALGVAITKIFNLTVGQTGIGQSISVTSKGPPGIQTVGGSVYGSKILVTTDAAENLLQNLIGTQSFVSNTSALDAVDMIAFDGIVNNPDYADVQRVIGLKLDVANDSSGTGGSGANPSHGNVNEMYGVHVTTLDTSSGPDTEGTAALYGGYFEYGSDGGIAQEVYGLYLSPKDEAGTSSYGIFINGGEAASSTLGIHIEPMFSSGDNVGVEIEDQSVDNTGAPGLAYNLWSKGPTSRNVFDGYIEQVETATPPTAVANRARIFTKDNGSGKTQLMVQFGTGSAVQIAIQP